MPFYGDPLLLKESILSVINQQNPDWTLTVIDDAYPEPVAEKIVLNFNDSRISFLRNMSNHGVSGTFQQALGFGDSEHLVILGCDDRLKDNYVDRIHEILAKYPEITYIQPGVNVIDDEGECYLPLGDRIKKNMIRKLEAPTILSGDALAASLLKGNWSYFPSICWRRAAISQHGFRQDMQIVLDLSLQLDLISNGAIVFVDNVPAFEYRRHKSSASSWTARDGSRFTEEKQLFREMAIKSKELGWQKSRRAAIAHTTSRLNALTQLPHALFPIQLSAVSTLLKHAFSR